MKQIRLAFCSVSEDWLLCFLLIGQLKVRFHFRSLDPLQKVISRAKLFALHCLLWGIPSPLQSGWGRERELVILAPILLRDPLIVASCRWPSDPRWPLDIMLPAGQTGVKASMVTPPLKNNKKIPLVWHFWFTFVQLCKVVLFSFPWYFSVFLRSRIFTKPKKKSKNSN